MRAATGAEYLQEIEATGLSLAQVKSLFILAGCSENEGAISVNAVSERLGLSLSATSRALDGLARQKLVQRTEDPDDRRVRRLQLTAKGDRLVNNLVALRRAGLERFVKTLDDEQRSSLDAALEAILTPAEVEA
jgi:DNA-binding MarR family transcriptional regulator